MLFFTADTHWCHTNIIHHTNRPFAHAQEMDETLIERWNGVVKSGDTVYHLGDVGLGTPNRIRQILNRLNGDIHWVLGNHDKAPLIKVCRDRFLSVSSLLDITVPDADAPKGERFIVLCHYAMRTWNHQHHGSWHLYGHSHGSLPEDPRLKAFDVGVDSHNFTPWSWSEVRAKMLT